jgi:hypothetical protein
MEVKVCHSLQAHLDLKLMIVKHIKAPALQIERTGPPSLELNQHQGKDVATTIRATTTMPRTKASAHYYRNRCGV